MKRPPGGAVMRRSTAVSFGVAAALLALSAGCSREAAREATPEQLQRGAEMFSHYCAGCHPDGGNALYPQKTLHRADLAANGITTPAGVVAKMRNPGKGMRQFDEAAITDKDALAIARYVLATFK
jgi:cytochrome c6